MRATRTSLWSAPLCVRRLTKKPNAADGWTFFQFALARYGQAPIAPGTVNLWEEYLQWRQTPAGARHSTGGLIGSPDTIRRRLQKFEQSNIDQIILLNQAGNNTHEHICESLEIFAKEVMSEFHDHEPEHQAWKHAVLAGDIRLEELDVAAYREGTGRTPTVTDPSQAANK